MKLAALVTADIYRDGGSYEAVFTTDDGLGYGLWLQRSKMPDNDGLHHRWLFAYRGQTRPHDCVPIVTGSIEEKVLVQRLQEFLAHPTVGSASLSDAHSLERLAEMLHHILHRESCLPADLCEARWRV